MPAHNKLVLLAALAAVATAATPPRPAMGVRRARVVETSAVPKPSLVAAAPVAAPAPSPKVDVPLLMYFVFWYVGNAVYNLYNTMALTAVGGKYSGLTMTVSTLQLGVCSLYAGLLWLTNFNPVTLLGFQGPEKMPLPQTTKADIIDTLPVGVCAAAAHSAGVFCLGADPLFGQVLIPLPCR